MTHTLTSALFALACVQAVGQSSPQPFAAYQAAVDRQLAAMLRNLPDQLPSTNEMQPDTVTAAIASTPASDVAPVQLSMFAEQFWGGRVSDLAAAMRRLQAIRPALESILLSEGVPGNLAAVVLVESAAQPFAQSPRRARGLWQLIPETARQYGLEVREGRDQRIEIEAATRAAGRYLRDLFMKFGNWPLALAAYNAGQDTVQKALSRSGTTTFQQLSAAKLLPEETRGYVPAVLGAINLLGPDTLVKPAVQREAPPIYAPVALFQLPMAPLRSIPAW